jgi:hypothetical protein
MQQDIINSLGGVNVVAAELGQSRTTVANWRKRGVPWRMRNTVAKLADQRGIDLPADFLQPA